MEMDEHGAYIDDLPVEHGEFQYLFWIAMSEERREEKRREGETRSEKRKSEERRCRCAKR